MSGVNLSVKDLAEFATNYPIYDSFLLVERHEQQQLLLASTEATALATTTLSSRVHKQMNADYNSKSNESNTIVIVTLTI